jgi:glycerol-3-phosphate cytidylyltransferase-like family protein
MIYFTVSFAFLKIAAQYGDLYVAVGTDENLLMTERKETAFFSQERVFMLNSIRFVKNFYCFRIGNAGF